MAKLGLCVQRHGVAPPADEISTRFRLMNRLPDSTTFADAEKCTEFSAALRR
jgi:hypothetical protein